MTTCNISNDIELRKILSPRMPPYLWDIVGYCGGLITIFHYNKIGIIIYSCAFVCYGLLNILFEIFTVSFEYSNNKMPAYKDIGSYNFYITNKKYILQDKNNNITQFDTNVIVIDNSKIKIELSIYAGENYFIKNTLYFIYLLGITKKNYTKEDYNIFKDNILRFV
jgi:hypothetical protein